MSSFEDAKFLLEDAKEQHSIIHRFYDESLVERKVSPILQLKIKHFLEDIRSALDYVAHYIYSELCIAYIPEARRASINVYFPIKKDLPAFEKALREVFKNLRANNKPLVDYLESLQVYKDAGAARWMYVLNDLAIENKHVRLTPQFSSQTTKIERLEIGSGIVFLNSTFGSSGNNAPTIQIGKDIVELPNRHPSIRYSGEIKTWVSFDFESQSRRLPVLQTLNEIYDGAKSVIIKVGSLI